MIPAPELLLVGFVLEVKVVSLPHYTCQLSPPGIQGVDDGLAYMKFVVAERTGLGWTRQRTHGNVNGVPACQYVYLLDERSLTRRGIHWRNRDLI